MTIQSGTRLGPYEVIAPIGAGGMGEVYKARDVRLERTVAIKMLPAEFAQNAQFRIRFEREAKTISSLNHPNICQIFDIGQHEGNDYLVMELLEGQTLAERLSKGPLPLPQALKVGVELAQALDRAHRQGIVHRDLKPSNIMLTKSGAKLLDFGLAKEQPVLGGDGFTQAATRKQLTAEGTILGTFQYMAPEQLEGEHADARSDIWALGAVLYEMVTGRKAFEGKSKTSLIAAIIDHDPPPILSLQPAAPEALDRVIRTCLEKDRDERWQNAHDVARELQWLASERSEITGKALTGHRRDRRGWWIATVLLLLASAGVAIALLRPRAVNATLPARLSILAPPGTFGGLTISPDGTRVTFSAPGPDGHRVLWIRPLNSDAAYPLAGTEDARDPIWSPDSRALAFFADGKLKRIDASGGTPITICDAPRPAGGSWNARGDIIFVPLTTGPVHRVAAAGGIAEPVLTLNESRKEWGQSLPKFLPDGHHFIYTSWSLRDSTTTGIYVASLDDSEGKFLFTTGAAGILAGRFILFRAGESLMARPFDVRRRIVTGHPVTVAEHIGAEFSASQAGTIVFEAPQTRLRQIVWLDRTGKEIAKVGEPGLILSHLQLSPDSSKAAVIMGSAPAWDIWVIDLARGSRSRVTFDEKGEHAPAWSPDGKQIAFSSNRKGAWDIYVKSLTADSGEQLLFQSSRNKWLKSWSPDGRFLSYVEVDHLGKSRFGNAKTDVWILPLSDPANPNPYFSSENFEDTALFSPDGRYMAYISDETGRWEVFVSPFPRPSSKWQISTTGLPAFPQAFKWRQDGREILYLTPAWTLMSVEIKPGSTFDAGEPKALFTLEPTPGWDVSSDGQRILVAKRLTETGNVPITVLTNWTAGL